MAREQMETLVVIAFPDEAAAAAHRQTVERWVYEGLLTVDDVVVVTVDAGGTPRLHQGLATPAAAAGAGALAGGIVGSVLLTPLVGALVGAALGGLVSRILDYGIPDEFVRGLASQLGPHTSALFLLVSGVDLALLFPQLHELNGEVLHTTLSPETEERLRKALAGEIDSTG